jgi:hypothetical protein
MQTTITVMPRDRLATGEATFTRAALGALVQRVQAATPALEGLSEEQKKHAKETGATQLSMQAYITDDNLAGLSEVLRRYCLYSPDYSRREEYSYVLEGAVGAFNKERYSQGVDVQAAAEDTLAAVRTSMPRLYDTLPERLYEVVSQYDVPAISAALVFYTDETGPWVAGLLSEQDIGRVRFSRKRLGAWLKSVGVSDLDVRAAVEQCKAEQAGAEFTVYPNDCNFADVYQNSCSSCMADAAEDYEVWDDIHPTTVYSSAYCGAGDNGLALFTVRDRQGFHEARGIWNSKTNQIVRWYGEYEGCRALQGLGIHTHLYALEGSWLALEQCDGRFIHPYLDGAYNGGCVEESEGRVYLEVFDDEWEADGDGIVHLSTTEGSSRVQYEYYACDVGEYLPRSEVERLPIQNRWVSTAWREATDLICPIIGEYMVGQSRILLDGVLTQVADRVMDRWPDYLVEIPCPDGFVPLWEYPRPSYNLELMQNYTLKEATECNSQSRLSFTGCYANGVRTAE